MASTFNLVRNSRVWFSTDVNASTGYLPTTGTSMTTTNTLELTVLDGFSFSQSTQQQVIQLSEAGVAPIRGQRAFNTALDPVDFSFSTYIRPYFATDVKAEEGVLWNALLGANAVDAGTAITITSLTRGSTTTNVATLTVSPAVNLTAAPALAIGDIINLGSFVAATTAASEWAGPAKITTATGGMGAATVLTLEYLTAPTAAATAAGIAGVAKIFKSPWFTQGTAVSQPAFAQVNSGMSNKNQLQKFGMYFLVDNALYGIDNCVLDSVSVDFSLDGIATASWTGKATSLRYLPSATVSTATSAVFGGTGIATGTAAPKATIASSNYITNKLSTMTLDGNIQGGGTSYTVALTGGNLAIANNISYVVPANIGVVNSPIGYFTGTRSISGNVTAYLRTGTNNSAQVLSDILTANASETKFKLGIQVGGSSNAVHADFTMKGVLLQVPTVETGDVMSTTINFTAQGYDPVGSVNTYDIAQTNDLSVNYFAV
jgi:hypothetical protein